MTDGQPAIKKILPTTLIVILAQYHQPPKHNKRGSVINKKTIAVAGFLAVFVPAGTGVREGILGLLFAGSLSSGGILAVMLVSRITIHSQTSLSQGLAHFCGCQTKKHLVLVLQNRETPFSCIPKDIKPMTFVPINSQLEKQCTHLV